MLGRLQGHRHANLRPKRARPHASCQNHHFGGDRALSRHHPLHTPVLYNEITDRAAFYDTHAAFARPGGERHCHIHRVGAAVVR